MIALSDLSFRQQEVLAVLHRSAGAACLDDDLSDVVDLLQVQGLVLREPHLVRLTPHGDDAARMVVSPFNLRCIARAAAWFLLLLGDDDPRGTYPLARSTVVAGACAACRTLGVVWEIVRVEAHPALPSWAETAVSGIVPRVPTEVGDGACYAACARDLQAWADAASDAEAARAGRAATLPSASSTEKGAVDA